MTDHLPHLPELLESRYSSHSYISFPSALATAVIPASALTTTTAFFHSRILDQSHLLLSSISLSLCCILICLTRRILVCLTHRILICLTHSAFISLDSRFSSVSPILHSPRWILVCLTLPHPHHTSIVHSRY